MTSESAAGPGQVRYELVGPVARLVLDQPAKKNAMSFAMWSALPELVARADADERVRLITVAGEGNAAFCAGADISQFGEKRTGETATRSYDAAVAAGMLSLSRSAKPTVAAIRGICFGGGLALAMCCSLRIASSDSRFRIPAGRLGLGYGFNNIRALVHRLGPGPVADILLTARILEAPEAQGIGILQRVAEPHSFPAALAELEGEIASNAPLTLAAIKRALIEIDRPEAERDTGAVDMLVARCFASEDYREGQAAFREKRRPDFRGR